MLDFQLVCVDRTMDKHEFLRRRIVDKLDILPIEEELPESQTLASMDGTFDLILLNGPFHNVEHITKHVPSLLKENGRFFVVCFTTSFEDHRLYKLHQFDELVLGTVVVRYWINDVFDLEI